MTQVFKDDAVTPVSVIVLDKNSDFSGLHAGDLIKVSGISKSKGFQGSVKRHGFSGGPQTRGQKNRQRAPGSIGATTPQRVTKGHRMPGRMGGQRITVKGLKIVEVNADKKQLLVKGAVPGNNKGKVLIIAG